MKRKFLLILLILLTNNILYSKSKEAVFSTASSFIIQKDSISERYINAKKLYENQDYGNSLKSALDILKNENSISNVEKTLVNHLIGNIYYSTRNNLNAIKYYKKTLNILHNPILKENTIKNNFNERFIFAEIYLNYGNVYYRLNSEKGIKKYRDSALYFYNEVSSIKGIDDDKILEVKSRAYSNSSVIYMNDSLYDKAKEFAFKSINIHKKLNNKVNEAGALGNLSSIYLSENNYDEAKKTYFKAIDLIRNVKTSKALEVREGLYYNLSYNLYKLKDYTAYDYQELSYDIKDSLRDHEFRGMITEVTEKYNFDAKKTILLKEEENKRLKAQRTFWVFGIGSFIIIISLLFWLNFYKLRQKNLGLQLSKNLLIQNQNIEKLKSESQVRILNATIDGKESERKDIAETLHDSVSALLSSANLHLQATRSQFKGDHPIEIDKTQEIITEASQKIRDLSHTLVSSVLLKFGLNYAIKDMADKYSNSQIKIETQVGMVRRYHQSFEIKVYNIIQEFVNNVLKHSQAKNATVELKEENGKLCFVISDDGIGFDKHNITSKDGLGLNQIEARIQMMKGRFHINSFTSKGTTIEVDLPILEKENLNHV
ncbi:MAG: ATP-binding protein [Polaribacter sp.]|uniref:tetratricopeptide repeat-containing sensor histidine kinase n=1 Tax=Polaribacter sp. TaxID=1920175 RepID=UPI002F358D8A